MLKEEDLIKIKAGGTMFTPTLVNALARIIGTLFEIGQSIGSSLRRVVNRNYCKIV